MQININSGDSLTAVQADAITTTAPTAKVDYQDTAGPKTVMAALSGVTAVTLLSGPTNGVRRVSSLSIFNGDSVAQTITLKHIQAGTSFTIATITLQVSDTLVIGPNGLHVVSASGNTKISAVAATGSLSINSAGSITDANGNELILFPAAVASAVNQLKLSNAATGNPVLLEATGDDTDINMKFTPKGAGFLHVDGPLQIRDSVSVTATVGGGTTGLIPAGASFVAVTSDNADKQISLPAASVGDEIWILVGATGCELISAVAAHKVNDVTVGATNEAALTATSLYWCKYVATNTWVVVGFTKLGAVEAALVPDSL